MFAWLDAARRCLSVSVPVTALVVSQRRPPALSSPAFSVGVGCLLGDQVGADGIAEVAGIIGQRPAADVADDHPVGPGERSAAVAVAAALQEAPV